MQLQKNVQLLNKFDLARKYNEELFHNRRHRERIKSTDEYKFASFYFPEFIYNITNLDKTDSTYQQQVHDLMNVANEMMESMFAKYKALNASLATRRLFVATALTVRSQFIQWKKSRKFKNSPLNLLQILQSWLLRKISDKIISSE